MDEVRFREDVRWLRLTVGEAGALRADDPEPELALGEEDEALWVKSEAADTNESWLIFGKSVIRPSSNSVLVSDFLKMLIAWMAAEARGSQANFTMSFCSRTTKNITISYFSLLSFSHLK